MKMKLLQKIRRQKKGMTSFEIVVSVMVVLVILCGFVDLTSILNRLNTVSQNTAYVSRVIGRQGGVQTQEIENFDGRYVTSKELYRNVKQSMNSTGISDDEWEMRIDGMTVTPSSNLPIKDYGTTMGVEVEVSYNWDLTDNFVPMDFSNTKVSENKVFTTYKVRNLDFEQE